MRRRVAEKRVVLPDPKYGSIDVARLINRVMLSGKRSVAESIVYTALDIFWSRVREGVEKSDEPLEGQDGAEGGNALLSSLDKAIANVTPMVEVKSRRVGGATYQIPIEVPLVRRLALALGMIVEAARKRSEKGMARRLASELHDAFMKRGGAFKKYEDMLRMAKANQAFASYRWT